MKKSLSLVLAIAMVFSMFSSMAFAGENQSAGEYLQSIGVVKGTLSGDLQENDTWSRQDVTVILSRLMGAEAEAAATAKAHTFADVTNPFYDGYISWAKAEGLFNGHSDVRFGYEESISNQQFLAVMTRALGYSFDYNNVVEEAIALGLVDAGIDAKAEATRGSYYNVVVQTLHTVTADGQVLGNKLSLEGFAPAVAEYAVVDSKNIEFTMSNGEVVAVELEEALVANTATEVTFEFDGTEYTVEVIWEVDALVATGASATNLKEIVVAFNQPVDSTTAGNKDNYTVNGAVPASVKVSEDKMSATLVLTTALAQQAKAEVVVKTAVKSAGGTALAAEAKLTIDAVIDTTIPVAESIKLVGPNKFEVTFSEPVKEELATNEILVNGGVYGVASKTVSGNVLTVTLSASTLAEGTYTVKVGKYRDFADFTAVAKTFDLVYVKDATAPTATLKSATQTEVVVTFNKAVKANNVALTEDYFYHTYTAWKPVDVNASADFKTYTLSFKDADPATQDYYLPEGTVNITVLKKVGDHAAKDEWGNELAADTVLTATISVDRVAPVVEKVEAPAENSIKITFSEKVAEAVAETTTNYVIKNSEDKVVTPTITGAVLNADNEKEVTLTLSAKLSGGNYTVEVKNVTDKALSANKMATVTLAFTVTDKTSVDVSAATIVDNATAKEQYVYVTFTEKVAVDGANSALNKTNYVFKNGLTTTALASGDKVEAFGSTGDKVKITVKYRSDVAVVAVGHTLEVGRIADLSGNVPDALTLTKVIANEGVPVIEKIVTKDLQTIEITVDKVLNTVVADGFTVSGDVYTLASVGYTVKDGKTIITGVLKAEVQLADGSDTSIDVRTVANKLVSDTGQKMAADTYTDITDGIAPSYKAIADIDAVEGDFTIQFSEAVAAPNGNILAATDLVIVDKDGKTLVAGVSYEIEAIAGDLVTIDLIGGYATYTGKLTVSTKDAVNYLTDVVAVGKTANKATAFSGKEVTID